MNPSFDIASMPQLGLGDGALLLHGKKRPRTE